METINDLGKYTFPALLANSIRKFGERPALTLIGGTPITYAQIGEKSVAVAKMLKGLGLKDGSKVAIFGTGRPEWGISYFGIVSYGMIAVPLLPDFSDTEIAAIFEHCGVDAVFVESKLYSKLEKLGNKLPSIVINLEDFKIIKGPKGCGQNITDYAEQSEPVSNTQEEDTASIIYTSGTTGRSKGVELTHKNLVWTCVQCQHTHRVHKLDRTLSFLPLSHVYEFTVSFSMQLLNGACVYYLGKPPIVSALLPAFKIVQPTIVLSVPLVMEKIYKNSVLPNFTKNNFIKFLYKMRGTQIILNRVAGKKLITVGYAQVGAESDWRLANTASFKSTFTEENGYKLIFDDAQQKTENQIKAMRSFIQQDVDYIVVAPNVETGWETVLTECKASGIPVILSDHSPRFRQYRGFLHCLP